MIISYLENISEEIARHGYSLKKNTDKEVLAEGCPFLRFLAILVTIMIVLAFSNCSVFKYFAN